MAVIDLPCLPHGGRFWGAYWSVTWPSGYATLSMLATRYSLADMLLLAPDGTERYYNFHDRFSVSYTPSHQLDPASGGTVREWLGLL